MGPGGVPCAAALMARDAFRKVSREVGAGRRDTAAEEEEEEEEEAPPPWGTSEDDMGKRGFEGNGGDEGDLEEQGLFCSRALFFFCPFCFFVSVFSVSTQGRQTQTKHL